MAPDTFGEEGYLSRRKEGMSRQIRAYLVLAIVVVLSAMVVYLLLPADIFENKMVLPVCGDGTFLDSCSLNKPYYCDSGFLIYDAKVCGCPASLEKRNDTCVSDFYEDEYSVNLRYVVRGKEGVISLEMYDAVLEEVSRKKVVLNYREGEIPRRDDFKMIKINNEVQRDALMPLVVEIQNRAPNSVVDQARIAISLVQNIKYGEPEFQTVFGKYQVRLSRYPYETLTEYTGSCEGKSELLAFLLKELGYGVALFYYGPENHEAVGIKCPIDESLGGTGYCFVETTVPAPISYSTGKYLGIQGGYLMSEPQPVIVSKGIDLPEGLYEYKDADALDMLMTGKGWHVDRKGYYAELVEKYGLSY